MSTGVKKDDAVFWSFGDRFLHSSKVKTFRGFREVWVRSNGNGDIGKDLVVVGPGWAAEIDLGVTRIELSQEESTQMYCSCARNCLEGACALFSNGRRIGTKNEFCCGGREGVQTGDGKVFVVQGGIGAQDLFCLKIWVSIY